jgi:chromosome segregation ATPase
MESLCDVLAALDRALDDKNAALAALDRALAELAKKKKVLEMSVEHNHTHYHTDKELKEQNAALRAELAAKNNDIAAIAASGAHAAHAARADLHAATVALDAHAAENKSLRADLHAATVALDAHAAENKSLRTELADKNAALDAARVALDASDNTKDAYSC